MQAQALCVSFRQTKKKPAGVLLFCCAFWIRFLFGELLRKVPQALQTFLVCFAWFKEEGARVAYPSKSWQVCWFAPDGLFVGFVLRGAGGSVAPDGFSEEKSADSFPLLSLRKGLFLASDLASILLRFLDTIFIWGTFEESSPSPSNLFSLLRVV